VAGVACRVDAQRVPKQRRYAERGDQLGVDYAQVRPLGRERPASRTVATAPYSSLTVVTPPHAGDAGHAGHAGPPVRRSAGEAPTRASVSSTMASRPGSATVPDTEWVDDHAGMGRARP